MLTIGPHCSIVTLLTRLTEPEFQDEQILAQKDAIEDEIKRTTKLVSDKIDFVELEKVSIIF